MKYYHFFSDLLFLLAGGAGILILLEIMGTLEEIYRLVRRIENDKSHRN